ncbi:MAG: hypothetical protein PHD48_04285 [Alphaproteobacteria bacterium]|nr:hypothetical protein [Alphaproteobacteria bacterium]
MHIVQGGKTQPDVDWVMLDALATIALAKKSSAIDLRGELEVAVIEMLTPLLSPPCRRPRAALEIALIHYRRGINALAVQNGVKTAEAHDHFKGAVHYMKLAASMPDYQKDLIPAKAMNCLAAFHENGMMCDNKLVDFHLLSNIRRHSSDFICPDVADYKTAFALRKIAAERGLAEAQWALGCMYSYGQGVDVCLTQAFRWLSKAHNNKAQLPTDHVFCIGHDLDFVIGRMRENQLMKPAEGKPCKRTARIISLSQYSRRRTLG